MAGASPRAREPIVCLIVRWRVLVAAWLMRRALLGALVLGAVDRSMITWELGCGWKSCCCACRVDAVVCSIEVLGADINSREGPYAS